MVLSTLSLAVPTAKLLSLFYHWVQGSPLPKEV